MLETTAVRLDADNKPDDPDGSGQPHQQQQTCYLLSKGEVLQQDVNCMTSATARGLASCAIVIWDKHACGV